VTEFLIAVLAAIAGAVVASVIAYPLGKWQGRGQTVYEERTKAVTEIRHKLRELQAKICEWSIPYESEYRLDIYPERRTQGSVISQQLEELRTYYAAKEPWLDSRTREAFREIEGPLLRVCFDFMEIIDPDNPPEDPVRAARHAEEEEYAADFNEWISESNFEGFGGLQDKWNREVERVVGVRPWWRRVFGG
jgi:DNA polymerase elongation subunit (family B)